MFSVGDKVRVIDNDEAYTTYSDWVEYYAPRYIHLYNETAHVGVEGVGEIIHIAKHGNHDKLLYLVKGEARISLVEADGLEEAEPLIEDSSDTEFNVGDEVKIIDDGKRYDLYTEWVATNAPEYLDDFSNKRHLSDGNVGTVTVIAKHCNRDVYLYLISSDNRATLISGEGIEHVTENTIGRGLSLYQMLETLEANPEKRFILKGDNPVVVGLDSDNCLTSSGGNKPISIYSVWDEHKEPVSFMEAFNAFRENRKDIYCILFGEVHEFSSSNIEEYSFSEELIDYGEWHIV